MFSGSRSFGIVLLAIGYRNSCMLFLRFTDFFSLNNTKFRDPVVSRLLLRALKGHMWYFYIVLISAQFFDIESIVLLTYLCLVFTLNTFESHEACMKHMNMYVFMNEIWLIVKRCTFIYFKRYNMYTYLTIYFAISSEISGLVFAKPDISGFKILYITNS